jgi:hypothetical protein
MSTTGYPRETVEFQPVVVTVDGATVTTGVTFAVLAPGNRPVTGWAAATTLGGKIGFMITGMAPAIYAVWAKVASSPETPVIYCGTFRVN